MVKKQIPRTPKGFNLNRIFIAITLVMLISSCAERESLPAVMRESTIVYPAKDSNDITVGITFSRFLGQKSGRQSAIATIFVLREDANVYAVIELENRLKNLDRDLMFHIDWIGPDGKSFYMKRTDLAAGDSMSSMVSSISVSPGKRPPGNYLLRIYLFRELIAEKYFELLEESALEKLSAEIIFYKSLDKETGEMKGVDTVFEIKKKGILRAQISIAGTGIYKDDELPVRLEWYGPDGELFYSKKSELKPSDKLSVINGSISITPDKRLPGTYLLRVFLFDEIITEKSFILLDSKN